MKDITFLYTVSGEHKQFVLPFIYFANRQNPNSAFEIHLVNDFADNRLIRGIQFLRSKNIEIDFEIDRNELYTAMDYRWILEPKLRNRFTYIGDIDILICEPILPFHLRKMRENRCIIDNVLRETNDKMSGLMFVETEKYYRQTRLIRNSGIKHRNNEVMLLDILKKSGVSIPAHKERPIHGQHLSLNRVPFTKNSTMSCPFYKQFEKTFFDTIGEKDFQYLLRIDPQFKNTLNVYLDYALKLS